MKRLALAVSMLLGLLGFAPSVSAQDWDDGDTWEDECVVECGCYLDVNTDVYVCPDNCCSTDYYYFVEPETVLYVDLWPDVYVGPYIYYRSYPYFWYFGSYHRYHSYWYSGTHYWVHPWHWRYHARGAGHPAHWGPHYRGAGSPHAKGHHGAHYGHHGAPHYKGNSPAKQPAHAHHGKAKSGAPAHGRPASAAKHKGHPANSPAYRPSSRPQRQPATPSYRARPGNSSHQYGRANPGRGQSPSYRQDDRRGDGHKSRGARSAPARSRGRRR